MLDVDVDIWMLLEYRLCSDDVEYTAGEEGGEGGGMDDRVFITHLFYMAYTGGVCAYVYGYVRVFICEQHL